jgi:hypothetical protein
MNCFNHHDIAAVGTCKHCGKGLCPECLVDLGHGLACRGSHEQVVADISALVARNSRTPTTLAWFVVPGFTAFMGLVFLGYGLSSSRGMGSMVSLLGAGFFAYAAILFVLNFRAYKTQARQ